MFCLGSIWVNLFNNGVIVLIVIVHIDFGVPVNDLIMALRKLINVVVLVTIVQLDIYAGVEEVLCIPFLECFVRLHTITSKVSIIFSAPSFNARFLIHSEPTEPRLAW